MRRLLLAMTVMLIALGFSGSAAYASHTPFMTIDEAEIAAITVPGIVPQPYELGTYVSGGFGVTGTSPPDSWAFALDPAFDPSAANSLDYHWIQGRTPGTTEPIIWDLGIPSDSVLVFPSIDHGPMSPAPYEALEFTVWGSNDPAEMFPESWTLATLSTVYADGWIDVGAAQESDDFASLWTFGEGAFQFVIVYANRSIEITPGTASENSCLGEGVWCSLDHEVDAVGRPGCGNEEITFCDEFDGAAIDSSKWNTDIASSGVRWCTPEPLPSLQFTSPGEWIDPSFEPCFGLTVAPPFGTINVSGGQASFSAGAIGAFPYIWAGPPSRPSPFPSSGDFILTVRMKYDDITVHGDGFRVVNWDDTTPVGDNPPWPSGQGVFAIWSHGVGLFEETTSIADPLSIHDYSLEYIGGEYSFFVDGELILGPIPSDVRPNSIWMGNPYITHLSLFDWTDFTIDLVKVEGTTSLPLEEIDYFALGDSIASGHGLMDDESDCHRSDLAYPHKVVEALETRYEVVNFHHLACSGASALGPDPGFDGDPDKWFPVQVGEVLVTLSDRPTLVSITIGANDFGWTKPANFIARLYLNSETKYRRWVDQRAERIQGSITNVVEFLLDHENVVVVLTDYPNSVNEDSVLFFGGPGNRCGIHDCYERTEYLVHKLATIMDNIYVELDSPERMDIVTVHQSFHGHESPSPSCGNAPPEVEDTWIQFLFDPFSNSKPPIPGWLKKITGTGEWIGDCMHPNETGASEYARAVDEVAQRLGR